MESKIKSHPTDPATVPVAETVMSDSVVCSGVARLIMPIAGEVSGRFAGAWGGAAAGSLVFPPVGTVVGGFVGSALGAAGGGTSTLAGVQELCDRKLDPTALKVQGVSGLIAGPLGTGSLKLSGVVASSVANVTRSETAASAVRWILPSAVTAISSDAVAQGIRIADGKQDEFSAKESLVSAFAGSFFGLCSYLGGRFGMRFGNKSSELSPNSLHENYSSHRVYIALGSQFSDATTAIEGPFGGAVGMGGVKQLNIIFGDRFIELQTENIALARTLCMSAADIENIYGAKEAHNFIIRELTRLGITFTARTLQR